MDDKHFFLGVSDLAGLVAASFSIGVALFFKEVYEEITSDGMEQVDGKIKFGMKHKILIALKFIVRVSGSTIGSWLAATSWNALDLFPQGEWVVIGIGGAMGWKFLDISQRVFISQLKDAVAKRLGTPKDGS